jgi:hypothetical protein
MLRRVRWTMGLRVALIGGRTVAAAPRIQSGEPEAAPSHAAAMTMS